MPERRPHPFPTDLSDAEWAALEPVLPPPSHLGRPLKWLRRLMAEAIFYLVRSGCAWRMLPERFPSRPTVHSQLTRWRKDGTLQRMHDRLRELVRRRRGGTVIRRLPSSTRRRHGQVEPAARPGASMPARRRSGASATSWWMLPA
jgi:transposase